MGFGWRRKRITVHPSKRHQLENHESELVIPKHFLCPVSLEIMKDPVTLSSGITYDRESIEKWLEAGNFTCPVTNQTLKSFDTIPNHTLRKMIQDWCVENRHYGVERIQTPRVPIAPSEVSEILKGVSEAAQRNDHRSLLELAKKIQNCGTESERNRKCIVECGTGNVLAEAFDTLSNTSSMSLLKEILSTLSWTFPLNAEALDHLASQASLNCILSTLKTDDLSGRQHAIFILKELSSDQNCVERLRNIEELRRVLVKFIEEPTSPAVTKASLAIIFSLISSLNPGDEVRTSFVEMGLVQILIEFLVDSERSTCEKALGVLHGLCESEQGRKKASENSLAVPVLVKKVFRVSELATGYSVSILWWLCKYESADQGRVVVEALQVGAFQKLLLLLQVGCSDETKEKATELLKLLNPYRAGLECIESLDFKNLKRSF